MTEIKDVMVIPPNFGKDNSTLVCLLYGKKKYDKAMQKRVSQEYHGKFVFVYEEDFDPKKYDPEEYRYVFNLELTSYTYYDSFNNSTGRRILASYFIIDRVEKRKSYCTMLTSSFSKLIQAYMINLEKQRLKYLHKRD